jgi:hypothetical protein
VIGNLDHGVGYVEPAIALCFDNSSHDLRPRHPSRHRAVNLRVPDRREVRERAKHDADGGNIDLHRLIGQFHVGFPNLVEGDVASDHQFFDQALVDMIHDPGARARRDRRWP